MDPELLSGSESGIIVPDPDSEKGKRADNKTVKTGLLYNVHLLYSTVGLKYEIENGK